MAARQSNRLAFVDRFGGEAAALALAPVANDEPTALNAPPRRGHYTGVSSGGATLPISLSGFPVCQALDHCRIRHVGVAKAATPPLFKPAGRNGHWLIASLDRTGQLCANRVRYACRAGAARLLPSHTLEAARHWSGDAWDFCWVCFHPSRELWTGLPPAEPFEVVPFDPLPLRLAIEGLTYECRRQGEPAVIQHWVDLLQSYLLPCVSPRQQDDCLAQLWSRVLATLNAEWDLARLVRESGYSNEHLRRLCQRQLGRSPMHHVAYLRMQRAAQMLTTTDYTIEGIAHAVGYSNPFVFSNAFTRCVGWRPSDFRRKHAG